MNEERRPKVPPRRTNAYPRPSPTASRKTARAYLAISPALAARSCTPSILVVPCGRNHAATDHGSVVVKGRDLPGSDTVGRLLELEGEAVGRRRHPSGQRRRAVAQLGLDLLHGCMEGSPHANGGAGERAARTHDQRVRGGIGAERVERLRRRD